MRQRGECRVLTRLFATVHLLQVTVLAIRAVRDEMYIGMRESEARGLMREALAAAGLRNGDSLTLFGRTYCIFICITERGVDPNAISQRSSASWQWL